MMMGGLCATSVQSAQNQALHLLRWMAVINVAVISICVMQARPLWPHC